MPLGTADNGRPVVPANAWDAVRARELYEAMVLIRVFEEETDRQYKRDRIGGYCHLCIGQEGATVGACAALEPDDLLLTSYRSHGFALARGVSPEAMMAELFGRVDGCARGRGGSMHPADPELGYLGGWGIVGGQLPLAVGAAFTLAQEERPQAVLCELGEGAVNIGAWHEALNLAAIWDLPVVFLVMNNEYSMGSAVAEVSAEPEVHKRAAAFRMRGERVDGQDVEAVYEAVGELLRDARERRRPAVLEALTYRYRGHSVADPGTAYRSPSEVEEWRRQDPIALFGARLREREIFSSDDELEQVRRHAEQRVAAAVEYAERSELPPVTTLARHVYGDPATSEQFAHTGPGSPFGERELVLEGASAVPEATIAPPPPPGSPAADADTTTMSFREALRSALREELLRDESVFLIGEEIGVFEGSYKVTAGLYDEFGERRIREAPISEEGFVGMAVGAAMTGQRPVVEIMTLNFILVAMDQVVNHAAKVRYLFGGEIGCPLVIRTPNGAGNQLTAQHSQSFEGWFAGTPGLKVIAPATPADAKGLLKAAIRDDDPVLVIENLPIYKQRGEVPNDPDFTTPIGRARVAREGSDITLVAHSYATVRALEVAERLAGDGIAAEVVDLRSLRPLDLETVARSLAKTNRALCVEEGWASYGVTAELAARIQSACFDDLDAPVGRVGMAEVPLPYARNLEQAALPHENKIHAAALEVLDRRTGGGITPSRL